VRTERATLGDWAITVGVVATQVVAGLFGEHPGTGGVVLGYALLTAGGLALAARRRAPVAVLVVTGLCALGQQAAGFDVAAVAYLVAVYTAVRAGHRLLTVAGSVLVLVTLPFAVLVSPSVASMGEAFPQARGALELAWLIAAGAAGEAVRQAERRADEAERTQEETARRRADEERLHLARELHDSLTHQISVIKVQSEVAVHLARKRGEDVSPELLAIREAGREAARELRATLEVLRDDSSTPPRGIADVAELVRRARSTGLDANLTVDGGRDGVPATVDRTAYRIVQESLTNVVRHARATTASVRVDCRPDLVVVEVLDDGTATPDSVPEPGVGLSGMRERVVALGGRLRAGPRHEGGFAVVAELPLRDTADVALDGAS
jgi:signal transduction histidine kinase